MIEERLESLIESYAIEIEDETKNLRLNRYIGDLLIYSTLMMSI